MKVSLKAFIAPSFVRSMFKNMYFVFITANLWSGWPPPPYKVRWGASMCAWKDSLLVFGGRDVPTVVQSYNLTTQRHL